MSSPPRRLDLGALCITERDGGVVLAVRVSPGASRARVFGVHDGALKLAIVAPPEKGRANRELLATLALACSLPVGQLELLGGNASRTKTVLVRGISRARLVDSLEALGQV